MRGTAVPNVAALSIAGTSSKNTAPVIVGQAGSLPHKGWESLHSHNDHLTVMTTDWLC